MDSPLAVESKLAAAAPVRDDAACAGKVFLRGWALAGPAEGVGEHWVAVVAGGANVAVVARRVLAAVLKDNWTDMFARKVDTLNEANSKSSDGTHIPTVALWATTTRSTW